MCPKLEARCSGGLQLKNTLQRPESGRQAFGGEYNLMRRMSIHPTLQVRALRQVQGWSLFPGVWPNLKASIISTNVLYLLLVGLTRSSVHILNMAL